MSICLKRAYDAAERNDGYRVLVDRVWPRGVKKEEAGLDEWLKEIAPSDKLRKWFNHEPARWEEFKVRYFKELDGIPDRLDQLAAKARSGRVTLVYAAKDEDHNNAVALKEYLRDRHSV